MSTTKRHTRPSIVGFAGWTLAGAGGCVGALTGFTIGIFVLPATLLLVVVPLLAFHGSRNASAVGLVSGVGLVTLYVSYLNRNGPGDVCTSTAAGERCVGEWSPWPWLVAGLLLVIAGVVLFVGVRRRHPRHR